MLINDNTYTDTSWAIPVIGFFMYVMAFISGYILSFPALNIAGAFLFLFILLIGNFDKMFSIKFDVSVVTAMFILALSAVSSVINHETIVFSNLVKHLMIFIIYIFVFSYNFIPLYETKKRNYFIIIISFILLLSIISGKTFETEEEIRASGIFINPNNLSLVSLTLLYFINERKDSIYAKAALNLFVVFILIISATTGAMIAYLTATFYKYRIVILSKKKFLIGLLIIIVMSSLILSAVDLDRFLPAKKIINQYTAIKDYLLAGGLFQEGKVNYYEITSKYGFSSGVWRLEHWKETISLIKNSDFLRLLFGHGIGSSRIYLDNLPHNEYLRALFEQGIFGFVAILFFFITIYRSIDSNYKYLILMFAIFSFTENNLDNFMFMSLFCLFIATAQIYKKGESRGLK